MTYRARLEGTSETDSNSLISLIEEWVRGGTSVVVARVLITVDPQCSVAISSLSEEECSTPPPTDSTEPPTNASTTDTATTDTINPSSMISSDTTDPTVSTDKEDSFDTTIAGITGGVVAVVIVLIIAIFITVIVAMILKNRRGSLTLKDK